ncbi:cytidine deaminase [Pontiella sulfatireligans]|uniref:Cytidine deaminase n=1 Tax=Pontiella sulfatireligans TaxID=2750658 RepID=A0A6C2UHY0_9BACT|nr:cytidine deaminase [Pontiella sulfatireligans]VGO19822.1 Cytidine deaminase [Pontiella sulfatireligans]
MKPQQLIEIASQALENAHAPYSNYRVGAALLCADGTVFLGCNVENASFGLTNCAERTAVFSAVAAGQIQFTAIAIAASGEPAPFPCGACRQVLVEFCGPDFPVYVAQKDGFATTTLGELLPHSFDFRASND